MSVSREKVEPSPLKLVSSLSGSSPKAAPVRFGSKGSLLDSGSKTSLHSGKDQHKDPPKAGGGMKDRLGKGLTINVAKKMPKQTEFKNLTEAEFAKEYKLENEVMESTNTGMSVLFARRRSDKMKVVVKVRDRKTSFKRQSDEEEWKATTLAQLSMPHLETVCQYYDCIVTPKAYYVVMEKVRGQDLFEQVCQEKMQVADAREVIYQIVQALQGMHTVGRIHKDLKLENVMVDMNSTKEPASPVGRKSRRRSMGGPIEGLDVIDPFQMSNSKERLESNSSVSTAANSADAESPKSPTSPTSPGVKLIDFDTVVDWGESTPKARDVLGSDGYIAPEAYGGLYSPASDIYQVGIIMYKLLTKKFPHDSSLFDDKPGENWVGSPAMKRIQERLKTAQIDFSRAPLPDLPLATDLLRKMLTYDHVQRPSASAVLEHEFFKVE